MSTVLEIENLQISFGGQPVLQDFSLGLRAGERVVLRGPSGCGKSTLLRCILGFSAPASGAIRIFGKTLDDTSVWALRRQLAYVPQEPELGEGSGREILERPFHFHANRELRGRLSDVPAWMDRLGLSSAVLDKPIRTLSGGEKQRLALIGAFLLARPLLLLDEATSALDAANQARVAEVLAGLPELTVLSASHVDGGLGRDARVITLEAGS